MAADEALLAELRAAAHAMLGDAAGVARVLAHMADDVERAMAEPLPLFPVIHHCPASAIHMARYLRHRQPRIVFLELCEDLGGHLADLADCTFPVALQALAGEVQGHARELAPLSVVAPLTEMSAEYQAIAYALQTEGVELVLVDRSCDHVYQMLPADVRRAPTDEGDAGDADERDADEDDEARLHGGAVGVEIGALPRFDAFRDALLQTARMGRMEEWIALYVEEPTIGADTASYREVMFLVGSLFRRLGTTPHEREVIRLRDRHMWTRIHEKLDATGVRPEDCVFVCGAAHTACDDVPEFGAASTSRYLIPPRTPTAWRYGLIPSSFGAIEAQFGSSRGALSMAEGRWEKALRTWKVTPYTLAKKKAAGKVQVAREPEQLSLAGVLRRPPNLTPADAEELVGWSTRIVKLAREHRYLASTADAIAIYETSILLARMRARLRPSPYDFMDAAETCLEKGRPPGRKDIRALCSRLLGGDRVGQVGYDALPPLVQDLYDRLAPVGITAKTRTQTRVLLDFEKRPELAGVSRVLWTLQALAPGSRVARCILGERRLGHVAKQESWDVNLHGPEQRFVIELSFEGITLEQVLERRLRRRAWGEDATPLQALDAAEIALTLDAPPRLAVELGERAVELLPHQPGADDAPALFDRARRFVAHFRGLGELPDWLTAFVGTGYAHFASQLPARFADRGTAPDKVAAMLGFVFTLESLALGMGCSRSQVTLALEQAAALTTDPEKLGLLWAAEWLTQRRDEEGLRAAFLAILANPLGRGAYPQHLAGLLRALSFAPRLGALGVELLGRAFASLPSHVLLPWMPGLLAALEERRADVLPGLFRDALAVLPRTAREVPGWTAPWDTVAAALPPSAAVARSDDASAAHALLRAHPDAVNAWAGALGLPPDWASQTAEAPEGAAPAPSPVAPLVALHPDAAAAWAAVLG